MVEPRERISSYKSYLTFKHIIDVIREEDLSRQGVADKLGVDVTATWHVMRILSKEKVIKRVSYQIDNGGKKAVYRLVKDD